MEHSRGGRTGPIRSGEGEGGTRNESGGGGILMGVGKGVGCIFGQKTNRMTKSDHIKFARIMFRAVLT